MKKYIQILILFVLVGCKSGYEGKLHYGEVNQLTIGRHIKILASNDFMGRMPGTEGEVKTVNYLKEEFEKLGLEPGNGASYFQDVPVVEITGTPTEKMFISGPNGDFELNILTEFSAFTLKTDTEVSLNNSELIFAGYGIVAPEYNWNDYEGIDWTGKTAVVLVNDPGFGSSDSTLFKGNEMTYYGRWTYKCEEAARQGASGVIIIHELESAGYGWDVVNSGWSPILRLGSNSPVIDIQGWISKDAATKLFQASNIKNKNFKEIASNRNFKPLPLGLTVSVCITNRIKKFTTRNVVAILPGKERNNEYIIYSAHWDHLGIGRPINDDSIYNGAVDNASGTSCLLAIAEAFKEVKHPKRSIIFLATTAEEQGLLGSEYYAENPIYPLKKSVANINIDMRYENHGPFKDVTIVGYGNSEMDDYVKDAAKNQDRYIIPDFEPEKGYLFRMDHLNFAKAGIPFLCANGMYEPLNKGIDFTKQMNEEFLSNKYHKPSDEFNPETFELSGVRLDAQLWFNIGLRLANEDYFPKWYDRSEFKAARGGN
jgi:Zn-dependent M28 family amino/carboxypeptidase